MKVQYASDLHLEFYDNSVFLARNPFKAVSGGLHLSERAIGWLRERGMEFDVESTCKYGPFVDIPRHNPLLVKCIETLGEEANGPENGWTPKAELHVATISGTYYYIDDHDGGGEEVIDIDKMTDASE